MVVVPLNIASSCWVPREEARLWVAQGTRRAPLVAVVRVSAVVSVRHCAYCGQRVGMGL